MATSRWLAQSLAYVLLVLSPALGQPERGAEAPWKWVIPPMSVKDHLIRGIPASIAGREVTGGEIAGIADFTRQGKLAIVCRVPQAQGSILPQYRPVVFDGSGRRAVMSNGGNVGSAKGELLRRYVLDEATNPEDTEAIGMEVLDVEGWGELASTLIGHYRAKGIQTLPFPALDRPYSFELTTSDGKSISSAHLRGRVVVIECWMTPGLGNVASLKALYEEIGEDRLAIIGVNFDSTEKQALWAIDQTQMSWPQVFVLPDQERWSAWHDIATITVVPRTLVLDQSGVLRADITHAENYDVVRDLVAAK